MEFLIKRKLAIALTLTLSATSLHADTLTVTTANGAYGPRGTDGSPCTNGQPGSSSDAAIAFLNNQDNDNTARATSGRGGSGGWGGDSTGGGNACNGANGGASGNAQAEAWTTAQSGSNTSTTEARATSGSGGSGGGPGEALAGGLNGSWSAGGDAGSATATVNVYSHRDSLLTGRSLASGGNGGRGGGNGGDAHSNASAEHRGGGDIRLSLSAAAGDGGDSGSGGLTPGQGGSASAHANAVHRSEGDISIDATASFGNGGRGNSSTATPSADGKDAVNGSRLTATSTFGGNIELSLTLNAGQGGSGSGDVNGGNGGDARAENLVEGDTAGELKLNQTAKGGNGGKSVSGTAGEGGSAYSLIDQRFDSAVVEVNNSARGGLGATANSSVESYHAHGGTAEAFTRISNSGDIISRNVVDSGSGGYLGGDEGLDRQQDGARQQTHITSSGEGNSISSYSRTSAGTRGIYRNTTSQALAGQSAESDTTVMASYSDTRIFVNDWATGGTGSHIDTKTAALGNGGDGGFADATVVAEGSGQDLDIIRPGVSVRANAIGGLGGTGKGDGFTGGAGGTATAFAQGSSYSGETVIAHATQQGGAGGRGIDGASGGAAADSEMVNQVQGETTGELILIQEAIGGNSADHAMQSRDGGNARSILEPYNSAMGHITATASATGGDAGASQSGMASGTGGNSFAALHGGVRSHSFDIKNTLLNARSQGGTGGDNTVGQAGQGGVASAEIFGEASHSIESIATVQGGNGGSASGTGKAGAGGEAQLFQRDITARSFRGAATARATAIGGNGGEATGAAAGGDGRNTAVRSAVYAESAIYVSLDQTARGGNAGRVQDGAVGLAGIGSSDLVFNAVTNGDYKVSAYGGMGADRRSIQDLEAEYESGFGGAAFSQANIQSQGRILAEAESFGGDGGWLSSGNVDSVAGWGGDADARVHAIGSKTIDAQAYAQGGDGGSLLHGQLGNAGEGGNATSIIEVESTANLGEAATGLSYARAGNGGTGTGGGAGGFARAYSTVLAPTTTALAIATAEAGQNGEPDGAYGGARATVLARGLVHSIAQARLINGDGISQADAEAEAFGSESQPIQRVLIDGRVNHRGQADGETQVLLSANTSTAPTSSLMGRALALHIAGGAEPSTADINEQLLFNGAAATGASSVGVTGSGSAIVELDTALLDPSMNTLTIGLLNPEALGDGFDVLNFSLLVEGEVLIYQEFTQLEDALAFFDGELITIDDWMSLVSSDGLLDIGFGLQFLTSTVGDAFGFELFASTHTQEVPVPGALILFLSALAGLAGSRRLRR